MIESGRECCGVDPGLLPLLPLLLLASSDVKAATANSVAKSDLSAAVTVLAVAELPLEDVCVVNVDGNANGEPTLMWSPDDTFEFDKDSASNERVRSVFNCAEETVASSIGCECNRAGTATRPRHASEVASK